MPTSTTAPLSLLASCARARHIAPAPQALVVLQLGETHSALALDTDNTHDAQDAQVWPLALGLHELGRRLVPDGRLNPLAIEAGIAEVEDIVMPWHRRLPTKARLFSADTALVALAQWAGMPEDAPSWQLTTEAVEQLFNRWVALAQGRPASQDNLPTTAEFSATLLVLREWLHHLGFDSITVLAVSAEPQSGI